jgi:D-alanyl-D-alanine carboxypeptidase/D-alanyl-D-alanine-endopeptidase (penicillin-binding protein 4)
MKRGFILLLVAGALMRPAGAQLPRDVADRLAAAGIPAEAMGIAVQRLSDGATVMAHNAAQAVQPASTLKLLTSWAALEILGPAWRGHSALLYDGVLDRGVLRGNLYLRGQGDVDLDWRELERMLRVARLHGIREIRGDLLLDRSWFSPARFDEGVRPFDETPEFRYNVIPDALLLNANLVAIDMVSDGRDVRATLTPPLAGVTVRSYMKLVERACADWEDGWQYPVITQHVRGAMQVRLQGEFPRDCTAATEINVIERRDFAERLVRAMWQGMGGTWRGAAREGVTPPAAKVLAEHASRPLGELVQDINKRSDNPVTRVVFLALGATLPDARGPTAQLAAARVRELMAGRGIAVDGLVLENGSGLSRNERITPLQLAAVLRAAHAGPWAAEFAASLPIVGVDGAMRARLPDSPAARRSRIKTGTLRDASGVAGYIEAAGGERYAVAAIIDHPRATSAVARPILDALLDAVARGPARNPP